MMTPLFHSAKDYRASRWLLSLEALAVGVLTAFLILFMATETRAIADTDATASPIKAENGLISGKPNIALDKAYEIAPGITIIPDPRIEFVPNIGLVEGRDAVLVIDTGLGPLNGKRLFEFVREKAGDRQIYLTTTHFHPEHNFGASAFKDEAKIILNAAQADELAEKGLLYIELFKTFGNDVARHLEGTELIKPDQIYSGNAKLDLGGRIVEFREIPAHTRGDQMIHVPDADVVFMGDMVETRFFPIMPDADSKGGRWIEILREVEAMGPEIIIPGHGALAGIEVVKALRIHLEFVRERVEALVSRGHSQDEITAQLTPLLKKAYPYWDNDMFIPFEIAIFYAESTGEEPRLPEFD